MAGSQGRATASTTAAATRVTARPARAAAASLAATTRPRTGVTRKVEVAVPWRNSPAMPRTPRRSAARVSGPLGARTSWPRASSPSVGCPGRPANTSTRVTRAAVPAVARASRTRAVRVVQSFSSSAWTSRVMVGLLSRR
ncbi:MAG: hypothetical protein ACJ742_18145 [Actinomycetes bacterium]